jgi:hypothetical protein
MKFLDLIEVEPFVTPPFNTVALRWGGNYYSIRQEKAGIDLLNGLDKLLWILYDVKFMSESVAISAPTPPDDITCLLLGQAYVIIASDATSYVII